MQFHPEADAGWVTLCLGDGSNVPVQGATQDLATVRALTPKHVAALREWYQRLLDTWWAA